MKTLMFLILLVTCAFSGEAPKEPTKMVCGVRVTPGTAIQVSELITISNLRVFNCTDEAGVDRTAIFGIMTSRIPTSEVSVQIELMVFHLCTRAQRFWTNEPFRTTINRPVFGAQTRFSMIGPALPKQFGGTPLTYSYTIAFRVCPPVVRTEEFGNGGSPERAR